MVRVTLSFAKFKVSCLFFIDAEIQFRNALTDIVENTVEDNHNQQASLVALSPRQAYLLDFESILEENSGFGMLEFRVGQMEIRVPQHPERTLDARQVKSIVQIRILHSNFETKNN